MRYEYASSYRPVKVRVFFVTFVYLVAANIPLWIASRSIGLLLIGMFNAEFLIIGILILPAQSYSSPARKPCCCCPSKPGSPCRNCGVCKADCCCISASPSFVMGLHKEDLFFHPPQSQPFVNWLKAYVTRSEEPLRPPPKSA